MAVPPTVEQWLQSIRSSDNDDDGRVYRRGPYRKHKDKVTDLEWVFQGLSQGRGAIPRGGISALSKITGVPDSTLDTWTRNLAQNPQWRPSRDAYSRKNRIFTDFEEFLLLTRIQTNFLTKGLYYCDEDFKLDALNFYQERIAERERGILLGGPIPLHPDPEAFLCSRPFIQGFRDRHRLSLRRPRFKRRTNVTEDDIQRFIERMHEIMSRYPRDRVVNVDETNWKVVAAGFLTWATKGSEAVNCQIDNNDKEGVTVIAAVNAAGKKLPLTIIGKGKTRRCLAGYEAPDGVWTSFSASGWTTSDVMCEYLRGLRQRLYPDGPLLVLLDTYTAHRTAQVRATAAELKIDLIFIPPGCTDRVQPLDRRVFGVLKAYARQIWRVKYHNTGGGKVTRAEMALGLVDAWDRVSESAITSGWEIFDDPWAIEEPADDEAIDEEDGDYQQRIVLQDLLDL